MLLQYLQFLALAVMNVGYVLSQTTMVSAAGPCPTILTPSYSAPVVGTGYTYQLIVTGLTKPRGLIFDSNGALLVIQSGVGLTHISFNDNGGTCLSPSLTTLLVNDTTVGIDRTLYMTYTNHGVAKPRHRAVK
jgi:hypothetical protein